MKQQISVTFPDGTVRQYERGTTAADVANQLGGRIAREAIVAQFDDELIDLSRELRGDGVLRLLTADDPEGLEVLRHSTAHVLAQAVRRLVPEAKLAIGPPVANGFYYDFDLPEPLSAEQLDEIEEAMREIIKADYPFTRADMSRTEAEQYFTERDDPYKVELVQGLDDERPSFYSQGEFTDLCLGPHIPSTGRIRAFKLQSVAGAYWRGDSERPMLQRIYGTAFPKKSQLDAHLALLAEAEKRDHRRLGRELDLFSFRDVAPGFVFWHAKGHTLYRTLVDFSRKLQETRGYEEVSTPWIYRKQLWETSGHWDHFRENMFLINEAGDDEMAVKPMNCPGHCVLYAHETRSYRDLPIKIAEYGPLARYEPSGTLHGALRVRGLHQDDAHIFAREDQIEEQIAEVLELVDEIYRAFGMTYTIYLSTRPDKFLGEVDTWDRAEAALERALKAAGREYTLNPGDGAFYGPKLDFEVTDAIGRQWQCATVQLDFQLPERFDLTYVDRDGGHKRPVMIHRAILGSVERFIGIIVEHFAGAFPLWLAPEQVRIIPVSEDHTDYALSVRNDLLAAGLRVELDGRNEKIGYKIRSAQVQKIPYMLVVGGKEIESSTVAVRHRKQGDLGTMDLDALIGRLRQEIAAYVLD